MDHSVISIDAVANVNSQHESESRATDIIKNWLRTRYTLEFLGTWEQINMLKLNQIAMQQMNVLQEVENRTLLIIKKA